MISQEKVLGYLTETYEIELDGVHCVYDSNLWEDCEIIPAVWLYVLETFEPKEGDGVCRWEEGTFYVQHTKCAKSILTPDSDCLIWKEYKQTEKEALADWVGFNKLFKEIFRNKKRLRAKIPFLIRNHYSIPVEYYLWYENPDDIFGFTGGLVPVGPIRDRQRFWKEIHKRPVILETLSRHNPVNHLELALIPVGQVDKLCAVNVIQYDNITRFLEKYRAENESPLSGTLPSSASGSQGIPAPMADPGAVPAPTLPLVCSEKQTAPADRVPGFIQGEVAGIQGSVADVKRDTSLTELKKQTGLLERIAENTENKLPKPKTRLETLRDTYLTYTQTVNQNKARYLMRENHQCEYEEIWKIEHWGEDLDAVDVEIKRQEIGNIRAGVSQAKPKRS